MIESAVQWNSMWAQWKVCSETGAGFSANIGRRAALVSPSVLQLSRTALPHLCCTFAALMLHLCRTYAALMLHLCCTYATFCAAAGHHKCDIDPQSNLHFAQKLIPLQPSWNIVFKIYTQMKRCLCEGLLNLCLNPHSSGRWVKALIGQIKYDINIFKIPTILDFYEFCVWSTVSIFSLGVAPFQMSPAFVDLFSCIWELSPKNEYSERVGSAEGKPKTKSNSLKEQQQCRKQQNNDKLTTWIAP